ncbi:MAG: phosphatidate cytidylyltransferase [Pseudolabrys sp.]
MADAEPTRLSGATLGARELVLRVLSALVLAPLAVAVAYVGGWPFVVFWGLAAAGVLWEWISLVALADRRVVLMAGLAPLALAVALAGTGRLLAGSIVAVMGAISAASLAPEARRWWVAGSLPYAAAIALAPVALRADTELGFLAVVFLFAVVWSTDVAAYFVGRAVGGPKLMPAVSPKKTWSGAIGGLVAAVGVAVATAHYGGLTGWWFIAVVAVALSVVAQAGDLFESWLKRRFGAKDSSQLIPGHGGLMDRLDGFVAAAALAALIGLWRGGIEAPGRGLLMW